MAGLNVACVALVCPVTALLCPVTARLVRHCRPGTPTALTGSTMSARESLDDDDDDDDHYGRVRVPQEEAG